ncbi:MULTISPECIES: EcsC family protein [unclassified Nocardioides]|uniref:EcsC family protein n=1 Tax=unclassified Nocardioides TaxID=2615069 RepID=UPI003014E1E2
MTADGAPGMSRYEAQAWVELNDYWTKKVERRGLPPKVSSAVGSTSATVKSVASATGGFVRDITPQPVKNAGGVVLDRTLEPTVRAVVGLLELVTETVQELSDAEKVLAHHRANGHDIETMADLRTLDLEQLDTVTRKLAWRSRLTGAVEGGAMGALTFVPVAGTVAAIGADLVVMHALSTAIATRAAHAYGVDPSSDDERHHLERMLRKAWTAQAPKAGTVKSASDAFQAGAGRVRWSDKFRNDHRIAHALESLMKQMGNGNHVPIEKVVSKMPAIAVVTAAGTNSTVLGSLAKTSVRYGQTLHLARKHDLPLPASLNQGPTQLPA